MPRLANPQAALRRAGLSESPVRTVGHERTERHAMRIAYVFPSIPTRNDTDPDFAKLTRDKKDWLGQEAEAVRAALDRQQRPDSAVSIHVMYTYDAEAVTNNIEWFATRPPGFMTKRWWYQGKQWSRRWLRKIIDWRPDIVHWQMNSYAYTFHLASRGFVRHRIPYVYQHHGPHLARKWWVRQVLKYPHHHAARGIYITDYHEKQYREGLGLDPDRNTLVRVGYSTAFHPRDKEECRKQSGLGGNPILFWAGGINRRKDPLCVLEAFDRVADEFPEARFYMAGYGPQDEEVDQLIESRPRLKEQVTRLGYVNNEELPILENAADIFVMGSHGEGFCVASMEAMACGCFPVLTTLECFREQTQQGSLGCLFEPGDVEGCAEALRKAMGDIEFREKARAQVPDRVRGWAWDQVADRLLEVYDEVLREARRQPRDGTKRR